MHCLFGLVFLRTFRSTLIYSSQTSVGVAGAKKGYLGNPKTMWRLSNIWGARTPREQVQKHIKRSCCVNQLPQGSNPLNCGLYRGLKSGLARKRFQKWLTTNQKQVARTRKKNMCLKAVQKTCIYLYLLFEDASQKAVLKGVLRRICFKRVKKLVFD